MSMDVDEDEDDVLELKYGIGKLCGLVWFRLEWCGIVSDLLHNASL
jgi:hypothetical protein